MLKLLVAAAALFGGASAGNNGNGNGHGNGNTDTTPTECSISIGSSFRRVRADGTSQTQTFGRRGLVIHEADDTDTCLAVFFDGYKLEDDNIVTVRNYGSYMTSTGENMGTVCLSTIEGRYAYSFDSECRLTYTVIDDPCADRRNDLGGQTYDVFNN